jgi:hypothetical protein
MSPPDPKRVEKAMVSAQWAGLVRLDLDLAGIGTWDSTLVRHPRLLVPVDLQALYVPKGGRERFVRLPFALTTPDGKEPEPMPEPFSEGEPRPAGVHLHWALPDSLLSGELKEVGDGSSNRLGLPALPDRWLVLRIVVPRAGASDRAVLRGWVIEADTTRVVPLEDWPEPAPPPSQSGKTLTARELTGSVGGTLNWTGVYDAVANRFAFHDPLDDLADTVSGGPLGGMGSYIVAGWWSDKELDPLDAARNKAAFSQRLDSLGWHLPGDQEGGDATTGMALVDAARRESLGLRTAQRYSDSLGEVSDVTFQPQSYNPLFSAFAEEKTERIKPALPTHLYSTLLHGTINGVPLSGRTIAVDQRPRRGATGLAIGLHGDDATAALTSEGIGITDAGKRRDSERILAAFTGQRLEELGTADGVVDVEEHEHVSGFESRPGPPEGTERVRIGGEGAPLPAGRHARGAQARAKSRTKTQSTGSTTVFFQAGERSDLKRRSATEQRGTVSDWVRDKLGPDPTERSREVTRPGPRYYRPLEPIVAIRNAKRSLRHRHDGLTSPDGKLICRWPTQVAYRIDGVVDGDDLIPSLPGSGVPPEALTLARNALVLDPYLIGWLSRQAERQKAVPQSQAKSRMQAEAALRYGSDARYGGALSIDAARGKGDTSWAGARVTDQLRRFSLVAGVDADPIGITAWSQPWVPLWLEWEVELTAGDRLGQTRLEAIDLEPEPAGWLPEVETRTLRGRSPLNTGTAKSLAAAIDDWMTAETARDAENAGEADDETQEALAAIADAAETLDLLAASLDSLHDQLLGLPVGEYGVLNPRQGASETLDKPVPVDLPQLLLNGVLRLSRARIVDAFGRILDLPVGRTRVPARSAVPGAPAGRLRLNPRLLRPARWMFRLVDPADLSTASRPARIDQVDPTAMVNPVAGFLLPDHIDEALEFFDTAGNPLGQLMHEPFGGGVVWEIAPGRPGPADSGPLHDLDPAQQIVGHIAAAVMAVDARTRQGKPAPLESESALSAMLRAIDTTLWTVDTFAGLGTSHIAGLVGRPIAVVRALLRLDIDDDLDELDLSEGELRAARVAAYAALADRAFPVRVGELTRSDDGLLGFFVDDDYSRFRVVDKAVRDGALDSGRGRGHLAQKGLIPQIPDTRPIDHPYLVGEDELHVHPGQVVRLTLLMHPAGKVHLTSGLLPRKSLRLARDWTHPGLSVIAPSSRIGPVLIEPGEVRLPKISSFPKNQIWTRRDSPVTWRDDPILAATQTALLPELPAEVQEGYIRVGPDSGPEDDGAA